MRKKKYKSGIKIYVINALLRYELKIYFKE